MLALWSGPANLAAVEIQRIQQNFNAESGLSAARAPSTPYLFYLLSQLGDLRISLVRCCAQPVEQAEATPTAQGHSCI
jgi:hypothetical protein